MVSIPWEDLTSKVKTIIRAEIYDDLSKRSAAFLPNLSYITKRALLC